LERLALRGFASDDRLIAKKDSLFRGVERRQRTENQNGHCAEEDAQLNSILRTHCYLHLKLHSNHRAAEPRSHLFSPSTSIFDAHPRPISYFKWNVVKHSTT
jgi:hypothetical protein